MIADAAPLASASPRILTQLSGNLAHELRGYLSLHRARVARESAGERSGSRIAREYARLYDGLLSTVFDACRAAVSQHGEWHDVSLAAVGSYGRSQLAPCSDLDVRLLCPADPERSAPIAEALLYPLWDAGLNVGHQVVALPELIELALQDVTTATTLLDWRGICGDREIDRCLLEQAYARVFNTSHLRWFVDSLSERRHKRHQRFGDSVYLLEPDVKNGAGGLRDLDAAHWCARARYRIANLKELVALGVLSQREWLEVEQARNLLLEIRQTLHLCTGRRSDRLTFDLQDRVAELLGRGTAADAAERLMSDYYRGARVISRLCELVFTRARPTAPGRSQRQLLGSGLCLVDGCLGLESSEVLASDPCAALRLYREAVRRNIPVCRETRLAVMQASSHPDFGAALRKSALAASLFLELLSTVQQTQLENGSPLHDLHEVGLLVAMIPEFAPVVGRVHRDTYHVYTVDVHSVAAVDHLRALCRGELTREHPLASRLAGELPRHRVLFVALLLHDVGKAYGGAGHTERGVQMAEEILTRLGMSSGERAEVEHLIRHHLVMYEAATRRDLEDTQTLTEFCVLAPSRQALEELYLLTICDVTTTNPTSMTNWKRRMLDSLFSAAERKLTLEVTAPSVHLANVRGRVLELWADRDPVFIQHFVAGLPERYFYANEPAAIVEHALFAQSSQSQPINICRGAVSHPYFELWVVADDRPGLLAMITAVLSHAKLKLRSAQVYSWTDRNGSCRSLDIFWVRGPEHEETIGRLLPKLARELEQTVSGIISAAELTRRALLGARPDRQLDHRFATVVTVDDKSAAHHTIIEVVTQDRPALLYCLSSTLQQLGLSIWFAKINTEGDRVVDVFYVSTPSGQKVQHGAETDGIIAALGTAVERFASLALGPGIKSATA